MHILLKKLCLIGFISIFLHICSVWWIPVGPHGHDLIFGQTNIALAANPESTAGDEIKPDPSLIFHNRLDIYGLLIGVILFIIGTTAIVLSMLRWKSRDLLVLSFGIFSLLYGARIDAFQYLFDVSPNIWRYPQWFITYLVPLAGCIFVEQLIGKGWKSSIRILLYCQLTFALAAISMGIYKSEPSIAWLGNNIMAVSFLVVVFANMFRPSYLPDRELKIFRVGFVVFAVFVIHGNFARFVVPEPFNQDLEPVGLLFLYCCIGYVVASRFFKNERALITLAHELETAREIQSFILPQKMPRQQGLEVAARYVPMAAVAGDFYDFIVIDENRLGILVADVSGHGIPASLIASMVKIAFASQTPHAADPARVLAEVNRILCGKLESDFVTAGYLYIDAGQQKASYASAGHPPLLIWRAAEQKIFEYRTPGVVLGQFDEAQFEAIALNYGQGDRLFLYTDGIVEASNMSGEIFGWKRLKAGLTSNSELSSDKLADRLIADLTNWTAKGSSTILDDDLTLVVVDVASCAK